MMECLFCDLHIHSCLSPCGDALMTPNNIVGMAFIKGLDVIAVCDHNSARNLPAVKAAADLMNVLLLPGMELTTREEAHMLCYFRTVQACMAFGEEIYAHLAPTPNDERVLRTSAGDERAGRGNRRGGAAAHRRARPSV